MAHSITMIGNRPAPLDILWVLQLLDSAHQQAKAVLGATPSILSALRYRSVVAAKVLQAKPDDAVALLRAHRQTHVMLLGAVIARANTEHHAENHEEQGPTVSDLFEALSEVLSEDGQLILGTSLLHLLHEIEEALRLDSNEAGRAIWARDAQETIEATCDRFGAILCLAIAKEQQSTATEVCDALAWLAWTSGATVWSALEHARRKANIVDPTFELPDLEPIELDYFDAESPQQLVSWILDDEEISDLTSLVSRP